MDIKGIDIEKILPVYHKLQKSRHDILCETLARKHELKSYSQREISDIVSNIETLIADCFDIAQDELYGDISKYEAKERIRKKSISKKDEIIDIIFERANYYTRR